MTLPLSGNALSLEVLLEPIDPGQACGPSLRYDPDYDRLRELRREDDSSLPTGVWQAEAKRADWAAVEQLASELLQRRSKDLMLAAWLGEAWLQRGGLGGLQRALVLLAELCERYPEEVHPQAQDGDQSWRVPPIDWLLRRYAELLHTRLPLMGQGAFAEITLYAWQRLQRQQVASGDSKSAKAALEAAQLQQKKLDEALRAEPWCNGSASRPACSPASSNYSAWNSGATAAWANSPPVASHCARSSRNGWPCSRSSSPCTRKRRCPKNSPRSRRRMPAKATRTARKASRRARRAGRLARRPVARTPTGNCC